MDWTQDLREIHRMVDFLVRRERKLDMKADVAVRRLARLEQEHSQLKDEEREASLPDALADRTKVVKLVVDKGFIDKGFNFGKVPTGEVIFIHASVVRGAEVLMIGTDAWVQVVRDDARAQGVSCMQSLGTRRVERGERPREGKQCGRASNASSGVDGRAGSSVGEGSLRGVQPSSRLARRASQNRQCHVAGHEQPWPRAVLLPRATALSQQAQASSTTQEGSVELNHEQPLAPKKSQPCLTKHWFSTSRQLAKTSL